MKASSDNPRSRYWKYLTNKPQQKPRAEFIWLVLYPALYVVLFALLLISSGDFDAITILSICVMAFCGVPAGVYYSYYDGAELYIRTINIVILGSAIILLTIHPIG